MGDWIKPGIDVLVCTGVHHQRAAVISTHPEAPEDKQVRVHIVGEPVPREVAMKQLKKL